MRARLAGPINAQCIVGILLAKALQHCSVHWAPTDRKRWSSFNRVALAILPSLLVSTRHPATGNLAVWAPVVQNSCLSLSNAPLISISFLQMWDKRTFTMSMMDYALLANLHAHNIIIVFYCYFIVLWFFLYFMVFYCMYFIFLLF